MVATSQHLAAEAGLDAIKRGGNAIDAAVAAASCLTVVEPTSNGVGGDAFAIVCFGGRLYGLNSSGPAPGSASIEAVRRRGYSSMPLRGFLPVTVPVFLLPGRPYLEVWETFTV
jgi:gamma-glutamyltranspeptidase/glutathione hydrolase